MVIDFLFGYVAIYAAIVLSVSSITLPNNVIKSKPSSAGNETNTKFNTDYVEYSVSSSDGATCILFRSDAEVEVNFKALGLDESDAKYFPKEPDVDGECSDDDKQSIKITWPGYSVKFMFKKTLGGEGWYINEIEVIVDSTLERYHEIRSKIGATFRLTHTGTLFPTPVGKSFFCKDTTVNLTVPKDEKNPAELRGKLLLRKFQVQPFMYKSADFGPAYDCDAPAAFRDETAPIAVGSTLVVAVLATITGYAVYRHFKVKKVQYNTME